ncbi:MAG TPA: hypothetical protein VJ574_02885 [Candidatus Bathyarchaeia archaeon]|nr:hypothetical protein [Candidatus Bathyarchaeia archaeon]
MKTENLSRGKNGKREYLNDHETGDLMRELNQYFENIVEVPSARSGIRSLKLREFKLMHHR